MTGLLAVVLVGFLAIIGITLPLDQSGNTTVLSLFFWLFLSMMALIASDT